MFGKKEKVQKAVKEIPRKCVETAAYYHWLDRGCPPGDDLTDWIEAEREWADNKKTPALKNK